MHKNLIRFNCSNYIEMSMVNPPHGYNCKMRNGYPWNLGGDSKCRNFIIIKDKMRLIKEKPFYINLI